MFTQNRHIRHFYIPTFLWQLLYSVDRRCKRYQKTTPRNVSYCVQLCICKSVSNTWRLSCRGSRDAAVPSTTHKVLLQEHNLLLIRVIATISGNYCWYLYAFRWYFRKYREVYHNHLQLTMMYCHKMRFSICRYMQLPIFCLIK